MAQLTVRHRHLPGCPVRVTLLPQLPRRMVAQAFVTYGPGGAIAVRSRTQLRRPLTRPPQRHSERNITNRGPREPVEPWVPLVGGETVERLFRLVPYRLTVTVSSIGVAAVRVPILVRTIPLQSQCADPSRSGRPSLIINGTERLRLK